MAAVLLAFSSQSIAQTNWSAVDAGFSNPPAAFRLIQFSGHDGAALPVSQMTAAGIGGVQLYMQSDGYLQSEPAWANVSNNIAAVKAAGLQLWMTDENGYPSGMAGGAVVAAEAAHESRCLVQVSTNGAGQVPFALPLPAGAERFVHAFIYPVVGGELSLSQGQAVAVQNSLVSGTGLSGSWAVRAFALQLNREGTQAASTAVAFGNSGKYPNLLDTNAVAAFVDLTHKEYARRFGALPGLVDAFYSNEPNLMSQWWSDSPSTRPGAVPFLPWSDALPARFQQDHGYPLLPQLPALYGGTNSASKRLRHHFYETVGKILTENFSQPIADWAAAQGILSAGHPLQEEDLLYHVANCGDMLRFAEPMQIPACDLPMPDPGANWNYWMPKFLASVGQHRGRTTVAGLLDPIIYREQANLTPLPEHFRRIVNMASLCGVSQFQTYLYWDQYPADLYRGMNDYTGRLSLVLRGARSAATVGVYYPIETFQSCFVPSPHFWSGTNVTAEWQTMRTMQTAINNTPMHLARAGIDFNWLRGDWIREATVQGGCLVSGSNRYTAIVLPRVEILALDVASKLQQFEQAGGKIVLVLTKPVMGDAPSEDAAVAAMFASRNTYIASEVPGQLGQVAPADFAVQVVPPAQNGPEQEFFSARFTREGRRINYLVNNGASPAVSQLNLTNTNATALDVAVYNPLDGSVTARQLPGTVTVAPFSSLLVVENPATAPSAPYPANAPVLSVVNGNFSDLVATNRVSADWFQGSPAGWSGGTNGTYAVATLKGVAYANLGVLTPAGEVDAITQVVGTNQETSDVRLTYTITNLANQSSAVGVAVYGADGASLGRTNVSTPGTYTQIVRRVSPGTVLRVGFWGNSAAAAMGLTGVGIETTPSFGVINGDFSDLGSLTAQGGGWYQGVPAGWSSTAVNPGYAVIDAGFGNPAPAANLNTLSTLRQNVGSNSVASVVTLKFDLGAFGGSPNATVRVTDGAGTIYGTGSFGPGNNQTLSAYAPAGVPVFIEFGGGQIAWVDNVSVTAVPAGPGLGLTNGNFADLSSNTTTGNGWYGGVPAGWSSAAAPGTYSVLQAGGTNYANLNTLSDVADGFKPLRQSIGTVSTTSDVTVSFKATSLTASPYYLASAIYSTADEVNPLAVFQTPALIQGPATFTYSAPGVPAGTQLFVAFWTLPGFTPGITDVTVSTAVSPGGIALGADAVLELDPSQPVSSLLDFSFAVGSKIKVVGTNAPTGSAVRLLSTSGEIAGSPALEAPVAGYTLVGSDNLLWLRQGLALYNANFQDLSGLTNAGGGWYNGVPIGWTGNSSAYSVVDWSSGDIAANIETLGPANPFLPLHQVAGTTDSSGDVSLSFYILGLGSSTSYRMGAAIYEATPGGSPATWTPLAFASYDQTSGSLQTLHATNVAANTPIAVAFWSDLGSPGLDNVNLTFVPDAPSGLSYSPNAVSGTVGVAITPLGPPTVSGAVAIYSIDPPLPAGLDINPSTGLISGTPSVASPSAPYTVTASNAGGTTAFIVTVEVEAYAFNSWAGGYSLDPSTDGAPGADPDFDGLPNSSEFAFGTNPTLGNAALLRCTMSGGQCVISWLQRTDSSVVYTVQESTNLSAGPWSASSQAVDVGSGPTPPAGYEWRQISVPASSRSFYRVRASF